MTAVAPAHFLGLQAIGLFLRRHGRLSRTLGQFRILAQRLRHQWRCLGGCGECRNAGGHASGDLEKFPALHDFSPSSSRA
jgi:hypothetical protein